MKPANGESLKSDGCTFAPDWLPSTGRLTVACREHDAAYARGGSPLERREADAALRDRMMRQARRRHRPVRGWLASRLYWAAVRLFGKRHFRMR